jgi:succinate dehydrogenase / fumarate reductase, cytochrome b subunit
VGNLSAKLQSSVGKKFIMGATGLGLVIFVVVHLSENMVLLLGTREDYNRWTHLLESLGPALWVIELGLLAFLFFHALSGVQVWLGRRRARPDSYEKSAPAGGPSLKGISSVSMILTGALLATFVVWHVATFKYGPGLAEGYTHEIGGVQMRDLHRLVVETFHQPVPVILYSVIMVLLGLHLRHGFWSAFQSLGAMRPGLTPLTYGLGLLVAVVVGLGFLTLPLWIYFKGVGL